MVLGIYLPLGDSFELMAKSGQDIRFKQFYIKNFAKNFSEVYIFSYANEKVSGLPKNVFLIPNRWSIHRYFYGIVLPFLHMPTVLRCDVFRVYHLSGTVPAILSKLILKRPFVFNFAYNYFQFSLIDKKNIQAVFFKILEPFAVLCSNKVLAANKSIFTRLNRRYRKIIYMPNGVDTEFFMPTTKNKPKPGYILAVGRLERQKNYFNLIHALKGIPIKLHIVGSGSLKKELMLHAKKNKIDIKIENRVSNTDMPSVYKNAEVFVLPSIAEGHPKVLLEAMACGIPSVGNKIEGITDLIIDKKTGILCGTDGDSIRKAIVALLENDKLRSKLGINAREFIVRHFNLTILLKNEINILRKIGSNKL